MGFEHEELRQTRALPAPLLASHQDAVIAAMPRAIGNRAFGDLVSAGYRSGPAAIGNRTHAAILSRARAANERRIDRAGIGVNGTVDPQLEATIDARRRLGSALPDPLRERLEEGFDEPLSDVRVHDDATASDLARSVAARAFTVGSDIFFDSDEYRPGTSAGDDLIAHEVAHTIQQRDAPDSGPLQMTEPGDAFERDADDAVKALARTTSG
jgi:hypothetical protein